MKIMEKIVVEVGCFGEKRRRWWWWDMVERIEEEKGKEVVMVVVGPKTHRSSFDDD